MFVAFGSDFDGFRTWESFEPVSAAPGNDHVSGPRRIYINKLPGAGASAFSVGTIIVKESGDGDLASRHVFAMVKRGAAFNAGGAVGWEWFELANVDEQRVAVTWRGLGPENGDVYGGDATGGCNRCHDAAHTSDYVFAPPDLLER